MRRHSQALILIPRPTPSLIPKTRSNVLYNSTCSNWLERASLRAQLPLSTTHGKEFHELLHLPSITLLTGGPQQLQLQILILKSRSMCDNQFSNYMHIPVQ